MRLIDADALIKKLTGKNFKLIHVDQLEAIIKNFPTAEVPITHGHWIVSGRTNIYGGHEVTCSECGDTFMVQSIGLEHFCRNCGAKMERMKK